MNILETISLQCPYCNEAMELQINCAEGNQELTEECPVCCKPVTIAITICDYGVSSVEVLT
ncbi:MAG: CPXCG motif-containing cysteine-rich protein [Chlorobiaceae bacterium]